jgi:hypothetical protein
VPSLDLRFADNKSLVDAVTGQLLVTFPRASNGTFVDSAGVLQTAVTDAPRFDHNPTTGESLGLLVEEQRSNLLLNSNTLSTQSATVTAVAHTLHFTGTGTITLTGVSTAGPLVGTGVGESNRVSLTFTPTAGSLTLTVSGTVTNAQLEAGAFRTSYIATTGATATRAADVASITGSAFSSWYRQDEGTMFAEWFGGPVATNKFPSVAAARQASANNSQNTVEIFQGPSLANVRANGLVRVSNVDQMSRDSGDLTLVGTKVKAALGVRTNDFVFTANGLQVGAVDTLGTLPTVDTLNIGFNSASEQLNGRISRLTYWPQRLPNSTLQSITQ